MAPPKRKKQKRTLSASSSRDTTNNDAPPSSSFIVILSPAKTLDFECCGITKDAPIPWTTPGHADTEKTRTIVNRMTHYHRAASRPHDHFAKLLGGVSKTIAETAESYWNDFETNAKYEKLPCGFMFQGPAYKGLDLSSLLLRSEEADDDDDDDDDDDTKIMTLEYLQNHLRIVDPVWGWLKPMDNIPPYRLEMAAKNFFPKNDDDNNKELANYWKPALQSLVLSSSSSNTTTVIINLASDEYSAALLPLPSSSKGIVTVKVVFRNKGRVIAVHAKRARGLFARFLANHRIGSLQEFCKSVPNFTTEGYVYQEKESDDIGSSSNTMVTVVYDRMTVPTTTKITKTKKKKTTTTTKKK